MLTTLVKKLYKYKNSWPIDNAEAQSEQYVYGILGLKFCSDNHNSEEIYI